MMNQRKSTMVRNKQLERLGGVAKRLACVVTVGAVLTGCAVGARVTTVDNTYLEDVNIDSKIENLPFDHAWVNPKFDGRLYSKVYFPEIRVDLLGQNNKWERSIGPLIKSYEEYDSEARQIAAYFLEQIVKEFSEFKDNRMQIVRAPGPDVVTIKIALTELEFSHPLARGAALAAPIPGTGPALASITDPHMAFAARIYAPDGKLVATAADRKFPPTRIIDLNKLTVTSANREICSIWAEIFAEAVNKGRFQKTDSRGRFSILPW
jgi:hypothetical protein